MRLNKSSIIEHLAAKLGLTRSAAERYLNTLEDLIYDVCRQDGEVNWQGLGRFSVSHRKARIGTNPRTLQKITIPDLKTPKFVAGEKFKRLIK